VKELKDTEQMQSYIQTYQLESIFPEPLLPHLSLYSFEQGELVCSQGESSQYLYVLVEGKVKIYTSSPDDKTLILSFKKPLEVIGDIEYVRDIDIINTVEAVSSVFMIGVHHQWLKKYGSDHAPLLKFLLNIITKKLELNNKSMNLTIMYPVEVRLASYLLSVSLDEFDSLFKNRISISIKDAANLIGTSYRHLNRVIAQLAAEGLIERSKGYILIKDREGLRNLAGGNIYE
jgi:CRP-like cAMP-binding protein